MGCGATAVVGRTPADLTYVFSRPLDAAVRLSRSTVYRLLAQVGGPGVDTSGTLPGVLAAVDQHAAELRDVIGTGETPPGLVALAAYSEGLLDAAAELGWTPPDGHRVDWSRADWLSIRLRAVCALACATGDL